MATAFAAATSTAATAVVLPRLPTTTSPRCSALPNLPARSFSTSINLVSASRRSSLFQVKASEDASSVDANELFNDLKEKWDALENKSTVIVYGGGAIVAIWLSSIVIGAINSVPLLPKIMELVGLGYTGWFVYRYLLFKEAGVLFWVQWGRTRFGINRIPKLLNTNTGIRPLVFGPTAILPSL